jgi:hypothetical protein
MESLPCPLNVAILADGCKVTIRRGNRTLRRILIPPGPAVRHHVPVIDESRRLASGRMW